MMSKVKCQMSKVGPPIMDTDGSCDDLSNHVAVDIG